jgi:hypothetical protein
VPLSAGLLLAWAHPAAAWEKDLMVTHDCDSYEATFYNDSDKPVTIVDTSIPEWDGKVLAPDEEIKSGSLELTYEGVTVTVVVNDGYDDYPYEEMVYPDEECETPTTYVTTTTTEPVTTTTTEATTTTTQPQVGSTTAPSTTVVAAQVGPELASTGTSFGTLGMVAASALGLGFLCRFASRKALRRS